MSNSLPPILLFLTDQQRGDAMGCAGTPLVKTPNMDRIAAEGVRFSHACTVSPLCMPARASLVSGLYPHNHGMWRNRGELPADDETFFHHLQRTGYHVAYVGKSHFYSHIQGEHMRDREPWMRRRGIDTVHETGGPWACVRTGSYVTDHWETKGLWQVYREDYAKRREVGARQALWPSPLPEDDHLDSQIGCAAVNIVDEYAGDKPLCLCVSFGGPHPPWDPPPRFAEMYDPAKCPTGIPPEVLPDTLPEHARERIKRGRYEETAEETARKIHALYYAKIAHLDDCFGEVLEAFRRKGWLDDALIVQWSDHGEMLCDHGRLSKSVFFASALRIVMTLRWPGRIPAGQVSEALVETVDVFPTLLEAVGAAPSARCLGRSLWPCLGDPSAEVRDATFSEVNDTTMVRTKRYKYACDALGRGYMLIDLENDPDEANNLIGVPGTEAVEREMRERLLEFLVSTHVRQGSAQGRTATRSSA